MGLYIYIFFTFSDFKLEWQLLLPLLLLLLLPSQTAGHMKAWVASPRFYALQKEFAELRLEEVVVFVFRPGIWDVNRPPLAFGCCGTGLTARPPGQRAGLPPCQRIATLVEARVHCCMHC